MANVAAGVVVRPLLEEDRFDARLEILIVELRRLRVGACSGLLRRGMGSEYVQQESSRRHESRRNDFWQKRRVHSHLNFAFSKLV
jgi:hypothetical protein